MPAKSPWSPALPELYDSEDPLTLFPLFLKLDGKRCLVVGAGSVAAEKIESLLVCGARVSVVAPEAIPAVKSLSEAGRIEWLPRRFTPGDLDGKTLVIAATDDREINRAVFEEASRRSILSNAVDDPPLCDFFCASIVQRGDLQIAISTAGKSPALAQRLKREIDAQLAPDLGRWLDDLGELRREVLERMPPGAARKALLHRLAGRELCGAEDCPARVDAHASARAAREQKSLKEAAQ
jgi:precorrin-2 dehydrogenase / sirohydrochlorin ferrochelatase